MYVFMFIYCLKAPTTVVGLWFGSDLLIPTVFVVVQICVKNH